VCDEQYIETDDMHIINHELCVTIGLVPIQQVAGIEYMLDVHNNTPIIMTVYSGDLQEVVDGKTTGSEDRGALHFSHTIPIAYLRPNRTLKIGGIRSQLGTGGSHTLPGHMHFDCIELIEAEAIADASSVPQSLSVHPSKYVLTVPWQRQISPDDAMLMVVRNLAGRVARVRGSIEAAKQLPYHSNIVDISVVGGVHELKLCEETFTVGTMMSWYAYVLDPTIELVNCRQVHESHNYVVVKMRHPAALELALRACDYVLEEIGAVAAAFGKP
jgi:hypothetical protein